MVLFRSRRYAHGDRIEVAGAPVVLRVSPRARRVSLRLDPTRREIIATAPAPRLLDEAVAFAGERAGWIAAQLAELPNRTSLAPGVTIEVLGEPCLLQAAPGRARWRPAADGAPQVLAAAGEGEAYARAVVRLIRAEARRVLTERTERHAAALTKPMPTVAIMDARARWGSCRPPRTRGFGAQAEVGRIRYSWRLMLAPFAVMDYVAAHECAHLVEANHSSRFWAVVRDLVGDERPHRAWLRANGARLHAFG
ncbi:MAG: SprT family zinc-dependent metalloprotease [Caulobacteraceae bacterium]|nr:SprT family zinc-dependent metalloprotease [Caulobacteraceae bacterium]